MTERSASTKIYTEFRKTFQLKILTQLDPLLPLLPEYTQKKLNADLLRALTNPKNSESEDFEKIKNHEKLKNLNITRQLASTNTLSEILGSPPDPAIWSNHQLILTIFENVKISKILKIRDPCMLLELIKHASNANLELYLLKIFPKGLKSDILRNRVEVFLGRNEGWNGGMSLLDYSFLGRKSSVYNFLKALNLSLEEGGENFDIHLPRVYKVFGRVEGKPGELLEAQEADILALRADLELKQELIKNQKKKKIQSLEMNERLDDGPDDPNDVYSRLIGEEVIQKIKKMTEKVESNFSSKNTKNQFFSLAELGIGYEMITDIKRLAEVFSEIEKNAEKVISVDMEFCGINFGKNPSTEAKKIKNMAATIQLSTTTQGYFIDVLKIVSKNSSNLAKIGQIMAPLMSSPSTVKLFHSGEYDLRILYEIFQIVPRSIFDTGKAYSELLGSKKASISLQNLSKELLGVKIDKSFQVANWRIRPFPSNMVDYAVSDAFLLPLLMVRMLENAKSGGFEDVELRAWVGSNRPKKWLGKGNGVIFINVGGIEQ